MSVKKLDFSVGKKEFADLKKKVDNFLKALTTAVKKEADADVFLGGSFAKGTLTKSEEYDADIFVRFDWKYENLSEILEKILLKVVKEKSLQMKKMHGSRDYFRVFSGDNLTFEVIPVARIKRVREAKNVTDLSYFHVKYVKTKLNEKMRRELAIAKKFLKANEVYGAESYIHGFSGYGLECLIIYYKTFQRMIRKLSKIKKEERVVIDIEKFYKKKNDVFFELNESKLHSPIILIDPTWKERNVLASLSRETFEKFQEVSKRYLKRPNEKFFESRKNDGFDFGQKRRKGEQVHLILETDRQEGDIAGTKMKKFAGLLTRKLGEYFVVEERVFRYPGEGQKAELHLILKSKVEIIRAGPPVVKKKETEKFKRKNKNCFVRGGAIYAKIKINFGAREFLNSWKSSREGLLKMKDMSIRKLEFD